MKRQAWLDWQRGLAVLFMVEVHIVNDWLAVPAAHGPLIAVLEFIGGLAAPGFLYMAGVSQALASRGMLRKGWSHAAINRFLARRGLYILGVAYAFRVGEYLLGGGFRASGAWLAIFKVDILNVIGVALVLGAGLRALAPRRPRVLIMLGSAATVLCVVAMPPLASAHAYDWLGGYVLAPQTGFALFNWMGFLLAGIAAGEAVCEGAGAGWVTAAAGTLLGGGWLLTRMPAFFHHQSFWDTSPAWFCLRLGATVILTALLMGLAQLRAGAHVGRTSRELQRLGRHSLLGYMLSVELTYGLLLKGLQKRLGLGASGVAVVLMTAVVWLAVWGRERLDGLLARRRARLYPAR